MQRSQRWYPVSSYISLHLIVHTFGLEISLCGIADPFKGISGPVRPLSVRQCFQTENLSLISGTLRVEGED